MSSARSKIFASTSFRLSLVCAVVIALAFSGAGVATWLVTKSAAEEAGRLRIEREANQLAPSGGEIDLNAIAASIRQRETETGALDYLLLDPMGERVVGDLNMTHAAIGWSTLYLPDERGSGSSPDFVILNRPLPGGGALIIAEDLERSEGVRYAMLETLFWIGSVSLLFALGAGYIAARGALRRMDELYATVEKVGSGDLTARVRTRSDRWATDVDLLGERINGMLDRIARLIDNLRRVSTEIAHDLRTPLSHVRQRLDDVTAAATLESARAAAAIAQDKVDHLMRTFASMLRLAELDAGVAPTRFSSVDLSALVERMADAYRPDIEAAGGALVAHVAPGVRVRGDVDLLAQALANLLDNAIAHAALAGPITLQLCGDDNRVRVEVEDRGPGVPVTERTRVLEPFARLDRSRATPGAGLGLSIVSAIARLHEVKLSLDDAKPGLRVSLEWPQTARHTKQQPPASAAVEVSSES